MLPEEVNNNKRLVKLRTRLEKAQISNYEIISEKKSLDRSNDGVHWKVKSLVWYINMITSDEDLSLSSCVEDKYIMCILHENDYVDKEMLLESLLSNGYTNKVKIKKMKLAKPSIAEYQAGYKIGTIPPVAHDIPMSIYIDERLSSDKKRFIVGCGVHNYHLAISLDGIIKYVNASSLNYYIHPFVRSSARSATHNDSSKSHEKNESFEGQKCLDKLSANDDDKIPTRDINTITVNDKGDDMHNEKILSTNKTASNLNSSNNDYEEKFVIMRNNNNESSENSSKKRRKIDKVEFRN